MTLVYRCSKRTRGLRKGIFFTRLKFVKDQLKQLWVSSLLGYPYLLLLKMRTLIWKWSCRSKLTTPFKICINVLFTRPLCLLILTNKNSRSHENYVCIEIKIYDVFGIFALEEKNTIKVQVYG